MSPQPNPGCAPLGTQRASSGAAGADPTGGDGGQGPQCPSGGQKGGLLPRRFPKGERDADSGLEKKARGKMGTTNGSPEPENLALFFLSSPTASLFFLSLIKN